MRTFEIFFNDLKPKAQKELMDLMDISDPKEANWDLDILPIASLDIVILENDHGQIQKFIKGVV